MRRRHYRQRMQETCLAQRRRPSGCIAIQVLAHSQRCGRLNRRFGLKVCAKRARCQAEGETTNDQQKNDCMQRRMCGSSADRRFSTRCGFHTRPRSPFRLKYRRQTAVLSDAQSGTFVTLWAHIPQTKLARPAYLNGYNQRNINFSFHQSALG
jgi:hypothetical protein